MDQIKNNRWEALREAIVSCRKCPRLVEWREDVAEKKRRAYKDWSYWGRPVPGFGDRQAQALVIGLAPGAHGANRTGRVFTGDGSGEFLFKALHRAGFANQPESYRRDDGLALDGMYITAVCRCAPPKNRPTAEEVANCLPYLVQEMGMLPRVEVIVALGQIAFDYILRTYRDLGHEVDRLRFEHGVVYKLGENLPWLVVSYHPSRQNTQTGRLTEEMFGEIWQKVRNLMDG